MRLYEVTIQPQGGMGTPLKGDTLFGHFCWQVSHDPDLVKGGLKRQLARYEEEPFVVFSSAFPKFVEGGRVFYALRRPELPLSFFPGVAIKDRRKRIEAAKEIKGQRWFLQEQGRGMVDLNSSRFLSDEVLLSYAEGLISPGTRKVMEQVEDRRFMTAFDQPHNTINRLTQTTGTGPFAPYTQEILHYYPKTKLAVFVLLEESATDIERVCLGLKRIGQSGYGKDASIGIGRFKLGEREELRHPAGASGSACYTLAPCLPETGCYERIYFKPFVRYGKHGDRLALSRNPFKNPVIMADEAAVLLPKHGKGFDKPFVGRAVAGVSKVLPETVVQGYAPYFPLALASAL